MFLDGRPYIHQKRVRVARLWRADVHAETIFQNTRAQHNPLDLLKYACGVVKMAGTLLGVKPEMLNGSLRKTKVNIPRTLLFSATEMH